MQRFAPYLLDRLLDDPSDPRLDGPRGGMTLEQIKDSVARDIEALLNTRCALKLEATAGFREAARSVLRFGLDDFSARSLASVADRDFICRAIERAIADQEPRLANTHVEIDSKDVVGSRLRFTIRALLRLHPTAEPVNFDAVLQTGSQHYVVSQTSRPAAAAR
jgi:type VI secretion system protein ImpF